VFDENKNVPQIKIPFKNLALTMLACIFALLLNKFYKGLFKKGSLV
jgi:hypothetical protein